METFSALLALCVGNSPVNSAHKGQWRGAFMFFLDRLNGWVNNREASDLRRHRAYYDVIVILMFIFSFCRAAGGWVTDFPGENILHTEQTKTGIAWSVWISIGYIECSVRKRRYKIYNQGKRHILYCSTYVIDYKIESINAKLGRQSVIDTSLDALSLWNILEDSHWGASQFGC